MFRKLHRASRLSCKEWGLFFQAWGWLLFFDLGLRISRFPTLKAYASRTHPSNPRNQAANQRIAALRLAVDRARSHHIYRMTCLRRSLALQKMLTSGGIESQLKIGVRKNNGDFQAHAWIEYQGEPIGEPERITEDYSTIY
jgi:hypothetical protein